MNNYQVGDRVILKSGVIATIADDEIYDNGIQIYHYSITSDEFEEGCTRINKEEIDAYYFEQGEEVIVIEEDFVDTPFVKTAYLYTLPEKAINRYICVWPRDLKAYEAGLDYKYKGTSYIQPIRDLGISINGKPFKGFLSEQAQIELGILKEKENK